MGVVPSCDVMNPLLPKKLSTTDPPKVLSFKTLTGNAGRSAAALMSPSRADLVANNPAPKKANDEIKPSRGPKKAKSKSAVRFLGDDVILVRLPSSGKLLQKGKKVGKNDAVSIFSFFETRKCPSSWDPRITASGNRISATFPLKESSPLKSPKDAASVSWLRTA